MFNISDQNSLLNKSFSIECYNYHLKCIIIAFLVFIISLVLGPLYHSGDQVNYIRVYNELPLLSFSEGRQYYSKYLTSSEIVHFLFITIFSRITEKFIFISVINSILAYMILLLFRQWKVNFIVSALIVLTNYYSYILFFPAERLKFGVIFLIFSLLYFDEKKKFIASSLLSSLSHFQMVLVYISILFEFVFSKVKLFIFEQKISKYLILLVFLSIFGLVLFVDNIMHKVNVYLSNSSGIYELWKGLLFFIGAMIYSKNTKQIVLVFFPLLIFTYLLGGSRINMLSFFVFSRHNFWE